MTERTKTSPMAIAEDVIRGIMRTFPEKPIRVSFHRGLRPTALGLRADEEVVETPAAADGWYVNLNPGLGDVAICAVEPTPFGWNIHRPQACRLPQLPEGPG
jgi:hypothetical protein